MPSSFAGSGDIKNTSLNTVANNSSAMIEEGSIILTSNDTGIVKQETSMSEPAPVRHPGQPPHEVVFALPLRDDGKIWSGRATFTASKPIEVEVLSYLRSTGKYRSGSRRTLSCSSTS